MSTRVRQCEPERYTHLPTNGATTNNHHDSSRVFDDMKRSRERDNLYHFLVTRHHPRWRKRTKIVKFSRSQISQPHHPGKSQCTVRLSLSSLRVFIFEYCIDSYLFSTFSLHSTIQRLIASFESHIRDWGVESLKVSVKFFLIRVYACLLTSCISSIFTDMAL